MVAPTMAVRPLESAVWAALHDVHDPEIPTISVVDLGVVGSVEAEPGRGPRGAAADLRGLPGARSHAFIGRRAAGGVCRRRPGDHQLRQAVDDRPDHCRRPRAAAAEWLRAADRGRVRVPVLRVARRPRSRTPSARRNAGRSTTAGRAASRSRRSSSFEGLARPGRPLPPARYSSRPETAVRLVRRSGVGRTAGHHPARRHHLAARPR